jgi:hypothetical protein
MTRRVKIPEDWTGQRYLEVGANLQKLEPESSVLKKVTEALWAYGGVHVMRNSVGLARHGARRVRYGLEVGSADLVAIVAPYGKWLCIECKRPKNSKESEAQTKWLEKMRRYGAVAAVVRSAAEVGPLVELARKGSF